MNEINKLYKGKVFVGIYEFLSPVVMPIIVFQISWMLFSQSMLLEGGIALLISLILYLTCDEFKIFKYVKAFRARSIIFYTGSGFLAFIIGLFDILPLMLLLMVGSIFWGYYVYGIYKDLYNSVNEIIKGVGDT